VRAVPRLANYTLAFALQLRKKHGKISVRVANEYINKMQGSRSKTPSKNYRQAALRGGI
jgi:hypothetical protein